MSNFPFPFLQDNDSAGDIYVGALLYTYEAGTTTPLASYSDRALSSANTNPVVADSNGRFGEVYLTPNTGYKLVLKTSAGVTIWTADNQYADETSYNGPTARIGDIASNPLDEGAVGDGAADESAEVQAAIDGASGVVDLCGKTFRCDSAITLDSGITLRNGTLDFSNCGDSSYISASGSLGSPILLTGDAAIGAYTIDLDSVSGLASGDILSLASSDTHTGTDFCGELVQIDRIDTLTVYLKNKLRLPYTTANGAYVKEITPKSNIVLENLTVNCSTSASGSPAAFNLYMCSHARFKNVYVNQCKVSSFHLRSCLDVEFTGCRADEDGGSGYGWRVSGVCRDIRMHDCQADRIWKGVYIGESGSIIGPAMFVSVEKCRFNGCGTSIESTQYSHQLVVDGCTVIGAEADGLVNVGSYGMRITNNHIRQTATKGLIFSIGAITPAINPVGVVIRGNRFDSCGTHGIYSYASSNEQMDMVDISGNEFNACPDAIYIGPGNGGNAFLYVKIASNIIYNSSGTAAITVTANYANISYVNICDNIIYASTAYGVYVYANTGVFATVNVCNNTINTDQYGVYVNSGSGNSTNLIIANNNVTATGSNAGISVDSFSKYIITNNRVTSAGPSIAAYLDASQTDCVISGNITEAADNSAIMLDGNTSSARGIISGNICYAKGAAADLPIWISDKMAYLAITGNVCIRDNDSDDSIQLDGDAAGAIDEVAVVGNVCYNGDYGIGEPTDANNTNVLGMANIFSGMNSGAVEGTIDSDVAADDHNAT